MAAKATDDDETAQVEENDENLMGRREAMQTGVAAVGTVAMLGAGVNPAAASIDDSATINFSHDLAQDAYINGSVTVDQHKSEFEELDYVADDETRTSLTEDGIVLASTDSDEPNNPVSIEARKFVADELTAFPRGTKYDSDEDGDIDEDDENVSWNTASHWTTTDASNGTISLEENGDGSLTVSTSSVASGETVKAAFDLSTVGDSDATITDGMSRKFLQTIADWDSLPSGVLVEFAVIDSAGNEVTAKADPDGDSSNVDVLTTSTGTSKAREARVGELEDDQSVTLEDIQVLEVRVKETDATVTVHGLNLERAEAWDFGTEEYLNDDSEVETQTVREPTGEFSITSLSTLPTYFSNAEIQDVTYDVEQRASHLPEDRLHVRVKDTPDAYDREKEVEYVAEYEWPSAYALDVASEDVQDEVQLPQSRYIGAEVATGISDLEDWEDVEDNVSWTSKKSDYDSIGNTVTLLSSTSSGDRTAVRYRTTHDKNQAEELTSSSSSSDGNNVAVVGGGGSGGFAWIQTVAVGLVASLAFWKRKAIRAFAGF